jgi:hypothetical protein
MSTESTPRDETDTKGIKEIKQVPYESKVKRIHDLTIDQENKLIVHPTLINYACDEQGTICYNLKTGRIISKDIDGSRRLNLKNKAANSRSMTFARFVMECHKGECLPPRAHVTYADDNSKNTHPTNLILPKNKEPKVRKNSTLTRLRSNLKTAEARVLSLKAKIEELDRGSIDAKEAKEALKKNKASMSIKNSISEIVKKNKEDK